MKKRSQHENFHARILDRLEAYGYEALAAWGTLSEELQRTRVRVLRQGNFTIVQVRRPAMSFCGVGASKRNPKDKETPNIGIAVAFKFAILDYLEVRGLIVKNKE